jgi:ubiquinone/menaquinone biosynthesis C-methylase UbiE
MPEEKTWDFDEWAETYEKWLVSDDPVYARYDEVLDRVVEVARAEPGRRVLDIGTGTGNLAERLLARGAEVVGVDPSRKMLEKAAAKPACSGISLICLREPFLSLPHPDDTFDAVVSTYAFHHVFPPKKPACIREMTRVLKPGGLWVLGDLLFENEAAERAALRRYDWMEDEYFARIDELATVFSGLGMELHSQQFTPVTWVLWAADPGGREAV